MLAYIAAPLGDPDPNIRAWHRERANLLAALAFAEGLTPICVHTYAELAMGADTDPKARARGLARSMRALEAAQESGGRLWVLYQQDFTASPGSCQEIARWMDLWPRRPGSDYQGIHYGRWNTWRGFAAEDAPHLIPEFDRLATRPQVPE